MKITFSIFVMFCRDQVASDQQSIFSNTTTIIAKHHEYLNFNTT